MTTKKKTEKKPPLAPLAICRDESCLVCGWPETYWEGASLEDGPSRVGCRQCGWVHELDGGPPPTSVRRLLYAEPASWARGKEQQVRVHLLAVPADWAGPGNEDLYQATLCGSRPMYGLRVEWAGEVRVSMLRRRLDAGKACERCASRVKPGDWIVNTPALAEAVAG